MTNIQSTPPFHFNFNSDFNDRNLELGMYWKNLTDLPSSQLEWDQNSRSLLKITLFQSQFKMEIFYGTPCKIFPQKYLLILYRRVYSSFMFLFSYIIFISWILHDCQIFSQWYWFFFFCNIIFVSYQTFRSVQNRLSRSQ